MKSIIPDTLKGFALIVAVLVVAQIVGTLIGETVAR